MAASKIKKAKTVLLAYQVASAICIGLVIFFLLQTFQYMQGQKGEILKVQASASETQKQILESTELIKLTRDDAVKFIPANFQDFLASETTNSDLTRMFDQLSQQYRETGEAFFIRSINYSTPVTQEGSNLKAIPARLSLETSKNNLLSFLRDVEKTGLSSDNAFYILDPQSLNFSNLTSENPDQELNVDITINIFLRN